MERKSFKISDFIGHMKWSKSNLFLLAGVACIAFLLFGEFFTGGKAKNASIADSEVTSAAYSALLEEKTASVLSSMRGVGKVRIMITLESGQEEVYAQTEKSDIDTIEPVQGAKSGSKTNRASFQNDYVIVDSKVDGKKALVTTRLEPVVKGVVVVCDGGDDIVVVKSVTDAICVALGVSSNRVCVMKLN